MSDRRTLLDIFNFAYEDESITQIEYIHRKVHDGLLFAVGYRFEGVADEGFANLFIATGSDLELHGSLLISATGKAYVDIEKNGEYSGGDALAAVNLNDGSANTLATTFKSDVTIDTPGDAHGSDLVAGSSSPARSSGGSVRPGSEFIGTVDSEYVIVVQNMAGAEADIMIKLEVYEHEKEE